ncbi:MAG TPA: heme o synthase [Acidobacteriota bacterium]
MSQPTLVSSTMRLGVASQALAYLELTKPRVVALIVLTTLVGFYLGSPANLDGWRLVHTLFGTALAAAGSLALNQYLEREPDRLMLRTQTRPLPSQRLAPAAARSFGLVLAGGGLAYLIATVGLGAFLVTAATLIGYLFFYTPLKRRTSLCTLVGAVPGALPPVTGWVAARGDLSLPAWILFAILFLWQLPHSLAIAQLYRADYARAGFRLLPVLDSGGGATGRHVLTNSFALLVATFLPAWIGLAGAPYLITAIGLGIAMIAAAALLASRRTVEAARHLVWVSLVYLPILLLALALDRRLS